MSQGGAAEAAPDLGRHGSLPGEGMTLPEWTHIEDKSDLAEAQDKYWSWAFKLASKLEERATEPPEEHPTAQVEAIASGVNKLKGCVYVGHTNTDTDSVASAVGAAYLFGGIAARAEKSVNGEIEFACEYAGYKDWEEGGKGKDGLPPYFTDVPGATDPFNKDMGICLVDCNAPDQMVKEIGAVAFPPQAQSSPSTANVEDLKRANAMRCRIKGVIDHHALSEQISTAGPILLDIRPWGSACSIVTHMYIRQGKPIPVPVARLLLCGILSDTVNLTSPTTTEADRMMASLLIFFGDEGHVNLLAQRMFKAKTAYLTHLSAYELVRADQKNFTFGGRRVGFATLEVNEPEKVLAKADEIIVELRLLKKDKKLDFAFLSVVDLVHKRSDLIIAGVGELYLAKEAFNGEVSSACECLDHTELWQLQRSCSTTAIHDTSMDTPEDTGHHCHVHESSAANGGVYGHDQTKMDLGNRISRKLEFIPPLAEVLTSGWTLPPQIAREATTEGAPEVSTTHQCRAGHGCCIRRHYIAPPLQPSSSSTGVSG